jgi:hypothetical protein
MKTIGELLDRDLNRKIEEIIKVDQTDEHSVHTELTEYVATSRIRGHYRDLFRAIAEAPQDPHEGTGVWVSGFFGSGKSSFAKNLGYVLANRELLGHKAAELFKKQLADSKVSDFIDSVTSRIPTEIVMFDVQTDKASGGLGTVSISHFMYRALLRTLGYAEDFDIADLEQSLELDGRLEELVGRAEKRFGPWRMRRKMSQKMNEASAILNEMDPDTYPAADSWAKAQAGKHIEVTPAMLVEKTFELTGRRRPGSALCYIVDEVGAYVARSSEKIEDLRAVVEQLGKESKNRVKARKAVAPVWIVVTSQEKLDEVTAAIDSKRVDIAKLQDRFKYRFDLGPTDIREVTSRRVLAKTKAAEKELRKLFRDHEGSLGTALGLERTSRKAEMSEAEFVDFYPYPPHFLDLSIDIMSGVRLQPGAARHLGGSNRTIIKQAFEMLASERTHMAQAPVGRLVTLDLVFDLVEGSLASEKQKDISDIASRFGAASWPVRVAKAIVLLEFIRDLPRTERNLAAMLYDKVDAPSPLPEVTAALQTLQSAQFVRNTEEGYKLLTASEKTWDTKRRSLDPKPKDRAEIEREVLGEIFADTKLKNYKFKDLRSFKVGLTVNENKVEDGQIPLQVLTVESDESFDARCDAAWKDSQRKEHANDVYWVFSLSPDIDGLVAELFRSRQMVTSYEQLRNQGKINAEESSSLANEKNEAIRLQNRLRERLSEALQGGRGYFQGVSRDGSALGNGLPEIFRAWFDYAVPLLYPKLEMGSRPLKGDEAEEVLKAANLSGLPQVFYEGDQGLGLVVKEGAKYVPKASAPVAKEILDFILARSTFGEKVTGKDLEGRFGGIGYGWDKDLIRLVLAVLLRTGVLEVTYQGQRYRNHQDAQCRVPFTNLPAFRSSSFAPRETIDLKTLTTAADQFERITGQEVEIEEGAIAQAFKKLAEDELAKVLPALATAHAHGLDAASTLGDYKATLSGILSSSTDDCVRLLASEGKSFKQSMEQVQRIRKKALSDEGIATLRAARQAAEQMAPVLAAHGAAPEVATQASDLRDRLKSPTFYDEMNGLRDTAAAVEKIYGTQYAQLHDQRHQAFTMAVDWIRGCAEWPSVSEEMRETLMKPLVDRCGHELERAPGAMVCKVCRSTMGEMESDLAAVSALRGKVFQKIQELTAPEERIERVRVSELAEGPLIGEEDVKRFVEALSAHLMKLAAEGVRIVLE